ncbi:ABC transporter permease [Planomonospora venezuelensis]|uniref:Peptide/nickel transport system permease protein n=1 Tax=Planomonospora venezuelensis TaxID=1999 RepID=A0A841D0N0_PLAVE|nr:ABC transporter permease [Planomonospora venezuelensis]MBB5963280.1 peptide/nickel transport system permease protein [Planomonospora venezuelensis]GIN02685.1 peptide ABC transporter permease [Planomonospora venezuelensis]
MLGFVARRLALLVPILLGLSVLLFLWVRALPGGPAEALLGERATPEAVARVKKLYGLDRPWYEQYLTWVGNVFRGDLGVSSRTQHPVVEELLRTFPATVELALVAMVFAVGAGVPLGYLAARRHGTWIDHVSVAGSLFGITIPVFFLGYMLKFVFAEKLGLLPTDGRQDPLLDAGHPTGFYVLDGLVTGNMEAFGDALAHLVLPGVALGTIPLAIVVRITRASVLDVLHEDYVRTAEAKGLAPATIRGRHVLRNALLPVVTVVGLQVGLLLGGAVLTETVFAFPGFGKFMADSIVARDYAVLQGFILFTAVIFVLVNLLVDVAYGLIDPRVRVT